MTEARGWRWAALAAIGALAAVFASFNSGERVALNLGFTVLYRVPLVLFIFLSFLAGMITMFLLGLRHDLRVRRALREAGFGEPIAAEEAAPRWDDEEAERDVTVPDSPPAVSYTAPRRAELPPPGPAHPGPASDTEPPPR